MSLKKAAGRVPKNVFFWCLIRRKKLFNHVTFVVLPGLGRPVVTEL